MTRDEFDSLIQHYGGQEKHGTPPGLWPHSPLTTRELPLWFRKLQRYELPRVIAALEDLSTQDRRQAPSIAAVIETLRAKRPMAVPVPDWQHDLARSSKVTLTQLFQAARPLHSADHALAQCYREIAEQELYKRGREAEAINAYKRFAQRYPADADFWYEQIRHTRREVSARLPTPALPPQVGSFTHISALMPRRRTR